MPSPSGSCLTCIHFERMYRTCKYDERVRAEKRKTPNRPRLDVRAVDVRTFRCEDYLSWEVGLLPFVKPEPPEQRDEPAAAGTAQGR